MHYVVRLYTTLWAYTVTTTAVLVMAAVSAQGSSDDSQTDAKPVEVFTLDGITYEIPEPWTGNRIPAPSPAAMDFKKIPETHTHNGTAIYIVREACNALTIMMEAAKAEGVHLSVESGYRSYQYQKKIFSRMLSKGRTYEDMVRYVAPPGYSQHALGTAVDFYPSNWEFADLPAYTWLKENGSRYGFTETYSRTNELRYPWEAWHWNYQPLEEPEEEIPGKN